MKLFTGKLIVFILINSLCLLNIQSLQAGESGNFPKSNKTIKILTVGNSFANNACTYLEEITESVDGYQIVIEKANIGGSSIEKHAALIEDCATLDTKPYQDKYCLKDLLKKHDYDFITIQQVSSLSFIPESYYPFAETLFRFIRKHDSQSEIIVHQTWAYAPDCKRLGEMEISREEMHKGLLSSYSILAEQLNLDILPSGSAFYESFRKNSNIDLWKEDRYHANMNGCYLAGCIWFGKFFSVSPKKIRFKPEEMDKKTAKFFKKIAAKEIKIQKK